MKRLLLAAFFTFLCQQAVAGTAGPETGGDFYSCEGTNGVLRMAGFAFDVGIRIDLDSNRLYVVDISSNQLVTLVNASTDEMLTNVTIKAGCKFQIRNTAYTLRRVSKPTPAPTTDFEDLLVIQRRLVWLKQAGDAISRVLKVRQEVFDELCREERFKIQTKVDRLARKREGLISRAPNADVGQIDKDTQRILDRFQAAKSRCERVIEIHRNNAEVWNHCIAQKTDVLSGAFATLSDRLSPKDHEVLSTSRRLVKKERKAEDREMRRAAELRDMSRINERTYGRLRRETSKALELRLLSLGAPVSQPDESSQSTSDHDEQQVWIEFDRQGRLWQYKEKRTMENQQRWDGSWRERNSLPQTKPKPSDQEEADRVTAVHQAYRARQTGLKRAFENVRYFIQAGDITNEGQIDNEFSKAPTFD